MTANLADFISEHRENLPADVASINYKELFLDFCHRYPPTDAQWIELLILYSDIINDQEKRKQDQNSCQSWQSIRKTILGL